ALPVLPDPRDQELRTGEGGEGDRRHGVANRPSSATEAQVAGQSMSILSDQKDPLRCLPPTVLGLFQPGSRVHLPNRGSPEAIHELQREKTSLQGFIRELKSSSPEDRVSLLDAAVDKHGNVQVPSQPWAESIPSATASVSVSVSEGPAKEKAPPPSRYEENLFVSSDDELDIANFIAVDEAGKPRSFGPSSALHYPAKSDTATSPSRHSATDRESIRNTLIAQAALQRQFEHRLAQLSSIDGTPVDVAHHLLNLHWTRQHHTFLLTYRPAIMRDLQGPGPYCSKFLLNAIFACSAKYSGLVSLRGDPQDPKTAGIRFFRRCDELLVKESLLIQPTIPTIVGLLLLGSTYNSIGETSKGWLYTGYALRMVYELGLHLDPEETTNVPEEVEIRRRVFWGAFICDKLQSLYLGRPVGINIRDCRVSTQLLDSYEENELFCPPNYPTHLVSPMLEPAAHMAPPVLIRSVSTFQQLCLLSKIMTTIINRFYVVGATFSNARNSLQAVDNALVQWKDNLAPELDYRPWESPDAAQPYPPPNIMVLHGIYHSLIILLHRPFISDGHLRLATAPIRSWDRCSVAARCITSISMAYRAAYGLSSAPYILGYAVYVACTIHVRNAAAQGQSGQEHGSLLVASLRSLDELCQANPGLAKPASIVRRLIEVNGLDLNNGKLKTKSAFHYQLQLAFSDSYSYLDESPQVGHSVASVDVDAILNMFPVNNVAEGEEGLNASSSRTGLDFELPFDPLFGLMDGFEILFPVSLDTPLITE
ncbi:Uncharacterized protein TPAR_07286, partial [Tolypocladium paradoxum]